jgi:hypothetical protein
MAGELSNVAKGLITFDELAQATYEAYRVHLEGGQAQTPAVVPWGSLDTEAHIAWNKAVRVAHREIVKNGHRISLGDLTPPGAWQ